MISLENKGATQVVRAVYIEKHKTERIKKEFRNIYVCMYMRVCECVFMFLKRKHPTICYNCYSITIPIIRNHVL